MRGFVDLHCHWVAAIDDGARTSDEGLAMLHGLHQAGFDVVVATPHMRPGMFDNDRPGLERAFAAMQPSLSVAQVTLPTVHLASEHFFDDVVFGRVVRGEALPYPGGRGILVEFGQGAFPVRVAHRFYDVRRAGLIPVLAHPERYDPVWKDDACLDPLLDAGAHLLLDVCSLVGKYGRAPQRAAEKLLEDDAYEAACSDAHKPRDVDVVVKAIERLEALVGADEARRLLSDGPREIISAPSPRAAGHEPPRNA
ncbi:MAG TPA: CpsB/CapC family capsule biosynthesis tyrosine phosphatase [Polyangiaceae bacterium]|nr:CpsB/CapC family capsule biosynthesis tyrosine phosphatase [Polyangiaceae bacterium]